MALYKCKMCGGDLQLIDGNPLVECEYCGSLQTVPSADNEKKLTLFNRANRLRFGCEFDKAAGVYEALVADFPNEAEGYWGLVLCKYGIEYVDDPATGKKVPTCHRSSFDSVLEDSDFEQVLENADALARKVYRNEAKQIEDIRKGILEVSSKEDPYDIFICYKETAENGDRTLDSVLAQDVYDALTEKGYRVFFSRITLEDKLGVEYEPYIFSALNSAKVMLAFGTDYEYFNAVWVRNEWSRYLKLMEKNKDKHLIPCYKSIDAYDIPKEFAKLQAQDLGKVGALQDLLRGVDKLIAPSSSAQTVVQNLDVTTHLARGSQALEEKDWAAAASRFDLALVADPNCIDAHLGRLLADCKCQKREELAKTAKRLNTNVHYKEIINGNNAPLTLELIRYAKKANARRICKVLSLSCLFLLMLIFAVFAGNSYLNSAFTKTVEGLYSGTVSARDAYTKLSDMTWYKKDAHALFIAAAGMGDWNAAKQYEYEAFSSGTLYINDVTGSFIKGNEERFDVNRITNIVFISGITAIDNIDFANYPNVTAITISNGVTIIDDYTFSGCSNLESITIPGTVTTIGDGAFQGCIGLESITISDGVTTISSNAFQGCHSLESITIPDSVTTIGDRAFQGCYNLESITIPDGVTSIGSSAFYGCSSLTSITIPDSVTSIDGWSFANCSSLTSIIIPDNVTTIGECVFSGCSGLESITIPDSVTTIGDCAFQSCSGLESITIPDSVTTIGDGAFRGCRGLESITIPDSVAKIGNSVFSNCNNLREIRCESSSRRPQWVQDCFEGCKAEIIWGYIG